MRRVSGLSVVSHSCSGLISPRPLKRLTVQLPSFTPSSGELLLDRRELLLVERVELARRLALALRGHVDAEQRRLRHVHVAALDQPREVAEEQRQQQHLDVRAVDVRVGEDDELPVAQAGQVDRRRSSLW